MLAETTMKCNAFVAPKHTPHSSCASGAQDESSFGFIGGMKTRTRVKLHAAWYSFANPQPEDVIAIRYTQKQSRQKRDTPLAMQGMLKAKNIDRFVHRAIN